MAEWAHVNHDSPEWPAWVTLFLDAFMLENWSSDSDDPDQNAEQRFQLVRKFREIGEVERAKYKNQAAHGNAQPTEAQITIILTPLRPTALRHVARELEDAPHFVWLQSDYSQAFPREDFLRSIEDVAEMMHEEGTIPSDARYYSLGSEWKRVLDVLPEILPTHDFSANDEKLHLDLLREDERGYMESGSDVELAGIYLDSQQHLMQSRMLVIEDHETHLTPSASSAQFHIVWLDEFGNVVRETRDVASELDEWLALCWEAMGNETELWRHAKFGPKYAPGKELGPPFSCNKPSDRSPGKILR